MSTPNQRPMLSPVPGYRPPWWRKLLPARPARERHVKPRGRVWRTGTTLMATLGSLVIIFGCLGVLYGIAIGGQGNQPMTVVRAFCTAEVRQDYRAAFRYLSFDAVKQSGARFADWSVRRDQQYGAIQRCDVQGRNYVKEIDPNGAAFDVRVEFAGGATVLGTVAVHRYRPGGGPIGIPDDEVYWAVFSVDPELHLIAT